MKKSVLLLGLLGTTVCLTACGSKNFDMSFEDAIEIVNHSALQDILAQDSSFEQSFDIIGSFDSEGNKIDANISSSSKQSVDNKLSESSLKFTAGITSSGETVKLNGALDIKLVKDTIYLYLSSLDLTGDDKLAMMGMMAEGFKNQWFSIPMSGLSDVPSTFSVIKDSEMLNDRTKEIMINEGSMIYDGKFEQFKGYNAWKFSIDNEKLNALIKEYYDSMNNSLDEEDLVEVPELNIQNFEGYLVIMGKDKVTTVIENMDIQDENATLNMNGFAGEDYEINMSEDGKSLVEIIANKKGSKYDVSVMLTDAVQLKGTISPKLSKSSIDLKFDATLTAKSGEEGEYVIPFKGSWKYNPIPEFNVDIPENAQDLSDLLSSYLGGMAGLSDYSDEEVLDEDLASIENLEENGEENIENNTEDNTEETVAEDNENLGETENNEEVVEAE